MKHRERMMLPVASIVAAVLVAALPASSAQTPADAVLRDFEPTNEYILRLADGSEPEAKIYMSRRAGAMLILCSALPAPAVLVNPRAQRVEKVGVIDALRRELRPA